MVLVVANLKAQGNVDHGAKVFRAGITDPVAVYKAHLWWNRGGAAGYHFANGYREAAGSAGQDVGDALRLFYVILSGADKAIVQQLHARPLAEKWNWWPPR